MKDQFLNRHILFIYSLYNKQRFSSNESCLRSSYLFLYSYYGRFGRYTIIRYIIYDTFNQTVVNPCSRKASLFFSFFSVSSAPSCRWNTRTHTQLLSTGSANWTRAFKHPVQLIRGDQGVEKFITTLRKIILSDLFF